jgi:hypothetical protein
LQQQEIEGMCQASQDLALAYELSQDCIGILKEQKAHELNDWRGSSKELPGDRTQKHREKYANPDYEAIFAACSQPWS